MNQQLPPRRQQQQEPEEDPDVGCPPDDIQIENIENLYDQASHQLKTYPCVVMCVFTVIFDKRLFSEEQRKRIFGERCRDGMGGIRERMRRFIELEDDEEILHRKKRLQRNRHRRGAAELLRVRWVKFLAEHKEPCRCEAEMKRLKLDKLPGVIDPVDDIGVGVRRLTVDPTL